MADRCHEHGNRSCRECETPTWQDETTILQAVVAWCERVIENSDPSEFEQGQACLAEKVLDIIDGNA